MLYPLKEILALVETGGPDSGPCAAASLNIVDFDMVRALLGAAEELHSPVVIAIATRHWNRINANALVPAIRKLCTLSSVPVALHLDHSTEQERDIILSALDLGFTSIMIDGSKEEYDENVRITREITELAHARGISVEGELGAMAGIEGVADFAEPEKEKTPYTDPEAAAAFVKATGIDALAVAVGTAHGLYKSEPEIQQELIGRIADTCPVPLVLHGASGVPEKAIRTAVSRGIRKINYFSGFMVRAMNEVRRGADPDSNDYLAFRGRLMEAWKEEAKQQIKLYRRDS